MSAGTLVVKLGGSMLEDRDTRAEALGSIRELRASGARLVVVHGGGKRIDERLALLGIERRTHAGLRITDPATLDVVVDVLAATVNKLLVSELLSLGVAAVGLCGADGNTLPAERHAAVDGVDLGAVGEVRDADGSLVTVLLDRGFTPVVASIARHADGSLLNVNADQAASSLARALAASRLVYLTDVDGVRGTDGSFARELAAAEATRLLASGVAAGGMRPKLHACLAALAAGVTEVQIAGPASHRSVLLGGIGGTRMSQREVPVA